MTTFATLALVALAFCVAPHIARAWRQIERETTTRERARMARHARRLERGAR